MGLGHVGAVGGTWGGAVPSGGLYGEVVEGRVRGVFEVDEFLEDLVVGEVVGPAVGVEDGGVE